MRLSQRLGFGVVLAGWLLSAVASAQMGPGAGGGLVVAGREREPVRAASGHSPRGGSEIANDVQAVCACAEKAFRGSRLAGGHCLLPAHPGEFP